MSRDSESESVMLISHIKNYKRKNFAKYFYCECLDNEKVLGFTESWLINSLIQKKYF